MSSNDEALELACVRTMRLEQRLKAAVADERPALVRVYKKLLQQSLRTVTDLLLEKQAANQGKPVTLPQYPIPRGLPTADELKQQQQQNDDNNDDDGGDWKEELGDDEDQHQGDDAEGDDAPQEQGGTQQPEGDAAPEVLDVDATDEI